MSILLLWWLHRHKEVTRSHFEVKQTIPVKSQSASKATFNIDKNSEKTAPILEPKKPDLTTVNKAIQTCLKMDIQFKGLTDLRNQILAKESIKSETKDIENIHFIGKDNLKMRAQWLYHSDKVEFRLFKELADGLPEPIEIPQNLRWNPDPTLLAPYINYDRVYWKQTLSTLKTALENTLITEVVNSEVQKMDYYISQGPTLHCQLYECQCK